MRALVSQLLITFLFQSITSFAQTTEKALLQFKSHAFTLGVSKSEKLFIGTASGEMAFADSIKGFWHTSQFSKRGTILSACYFNSDTAFVCGAMSTRKRDDIIFRTVNGGKTWEPVKTGLSGWVDNAAFLDNGEAWLSVSYEGIVYTKDFGRKWKTLSFPNKEVRFTRLYFNNKHEGIIGSNQNSIAYTKDNCNTWITIPTPLDQKKYKKTAISIINKPLINRVAIFNDHLLVAQEGLVFYSKADSIDWVYMPGYTDFYTDGENSALFFETSRGDFAKVDSHLQPVCSFDYPGYSSTAACRNGSLFIWGMDKMWQISTGNTLIESPTHTNKDVEVEPKALYGAGSSSFGNIANKIYKKDPYSGKWNYVCTLPFATDSGALSLKDRSTILFSRYDDSLFYYNIADATVNRKTQKEVFDSFCTNGINKIIFSRGHYSHNYKDIDSLVYTMEAGKFVLSHKSKPVNWRSFYLSDNTVEIDQQAVAEFVRKIPVIYKKQVTIDDLEFTREEYDSCKRNILALKTFLENHPYGSKVKNDCAFTFDVNNLNFTKLLALVDSIKTIDPEYLRDYFLYMAGPWEENGFWPALTLINTKDEVLEIRSLYNQPMFIYFPWLIRLNGSTFLNTAIEINHFLKAVFPQFLDTRRIDVIQELVIALYKATE